MLSWSISVIQRKSYAQAGGKNKDGLSAAVDKVVELAQL